MIEKDGDVACLHMSEWPWPWPVINELLQNISGISVERALELSGLTIRTLKYSATANREVEELGYI